MECERRRQRQGSFRGLCVNASLIAPGPDQSAATGPADASTPTSPSSPPAPTATPDPARSRRRAVRVERAITAATTQIKDAEAFIQEHPNSPDLLSYVKALNALSAAVAASDLEIIERKSTELSAAFNHDPDYRRHLADAAEAQKKQSARFLGEALLHGEQQRAFIMDFIAKNPLAPAIGCPGGIGSRTLSRC